MHRHLSCKYECAVGTRSTVHIHTSSHVQQFRLMFYIPFGKRQRRRQTMASTTFTAKKKMKWKEEEKPISVLEYITIRNQDERYSVLLLLSCIKKCILRVLQNNITIADAFPQTSKTMDAYGEKPLKASSVNRQCNSNQHKWFSAVVRPQKRKHQNSSAGLLLSGQKNLKVWANKWCLRCSVLFIQMNKIVRNVEEFLFRMKEMSSSQKQCELQNCIFFNDRFVLLRTPCRHPDLYRARPKIHGWTFSRYYFLPSSNFGSSWVVLLAAIFFPGRKKLLFFLLRTQNSY